MARPFILAFLFPFIFYGQGCKLFVVIEGQESKTEISKKQLTEARTLLVKTTCEGNYKIISYEFFMKIKAQPVSYTGIGTKFNFNMAEVGSKIIIEKIKVKGPDGKVQEVEKIVLTVKK